MIRPRLAVVACFAIVGCGAGQRDAAQVAPGLAYEPAYDVESSASEETARAEPMAQSASMTGAEPAPAPAARAPSSRPQTGRGRSSSPRATPPAPPPGQASSASEPEPPAPGRMVSYQAQATVRVTTPKESVAQAVSIVEKAGGYVEQRTDDLVVLRVPVRDFRPLFEQLLALGEVVARAVSAQDITDSFIATDLRLRTQKKSRDRLIALLAAARTESEKLQILGEIARLTEQIDQLEMQKKTLESLASYSRVTLRFMMRAQPIEKPGQEPIAALRWILSLSPFQRQVAAEGQRFEVPVPAGMVMLGKDGVFVAESADGAVLWTSRRLNEPAGDATFWVDAIARRLSEGYTSERLTLGRFTALRLVDRGQQGYRYIVGVRARPEGLELVEIYYPSAAHEARYGDAVKAALVGGGIS